MSSVQACRPETRNLPPGHRDVYPWIQTLADAGRPLSSVSLVTCSSSGLFGANLGGAGKVGKPGILQQPFPFVASQG